MKKALLISLCVIMLLSLFACKREEKTENTTAPAVSAPVETEPEVPATEFDFGSVYNNSYSNTTMGIGISLPAEYVVTPNSELATLNGFDETLMTTDLPKAMENTHRAYIFVAMDNAGSYMNIVVENLKINDATFLTGKEYFEHYAEETKKEYEETGCENITLTPSKVTLAGVERDVEIISYTADGMSYSDTRIAFPERNYMAVMTLKGDTSVILNRIYGI